MGYSPMPRPSAMPPFDQQKPYSPKIVSFIRPPSHCSWVRTRTGDSSIRVPAGISSDVNTPLPRVGCEMRCSPSGFRGCLSCSSTSFPPLLPFILMSDVRWKSTELEFSSVVVLPPVFVGIGVSYCAVVMNRRGRVSGSAQARGL